MEVDTRKEKSKQSKNNFILYEFSELYQEKIDYKQI